MTSRLPVDAQTRARVVELAQSGMGRNAIARETGVSTATVTLIATEAGVSFDRSQTKAATEARTVDLAAARVRLAEKMAAAAEKMLDQLDEPYLVYSFGGRDNTYAEHMLDSAPVEVRRSAVVTAGIAYDKAAKETDRTPPDREAALSMIDRLEAQLDAEFDGVDDAEFAEA